MVRIFTSVKIQRFWPGLNPQTWVSKASMLTTRPPKPSRCPCKFPVILVRFKEHSFFAADFRRTLTCQISLKIPPVKAKLVHADRWTDRYTGGQRDRCDEAFPKFCEVFRNFAKLFRNFTKPFQKFSTFFPKFFESFSEILRSFSEILQSLSKFCEQTSKSLWILNVRFIIYSFYITNLGAVG